MRMSCNRGKPSGRFGAARPLLDQDFGRIVKALAALRAFAKRLVDLVSPTAAAPRGIAQGCFPDGIADANVHWVAPIESARYIANGSQ